MHNLVHTIAALASARTLDDITKVVRTSARALTGADGVTFVLRDGDSCFYAEEDAIAPLWKGSRFPLSACVSGWAMVNNEPVAIPDIYADSRVPIDAYRPTFVKSMFMMPIGKSAPVAALGAYWAQTHHVTDSERAVLNAIAEAAALALQNVELNRELINSVERERDLRKVAESAIRMKDDFLATLSHELRTPLHVIQSWVWQLKRWPSDPKRVERAADVIERNVALQSRLVEDLLDISRATSGKLKIQSQLVDLAAMCTAVVEVVQLSATARNISLTVEKHATPYIWGDPDRIQQILWNLVNNAIKFTPEGGRVLLRVIRGPRHACVVVEDSGVGVEPEFLPKIFDRFSQADSGPSRRYGGLGLGLAIVKELVALHGATVSAKSDGLDKGLSVTVEFPVPAVLDQPGAWLKRRAGLEPTQSDIRLDGVSVLVVDDEEEVLTAVEGILQHYGATVIRASDAAQALTLLQSHQPNVVVADIEMPHQNGIGLIKSIRALVSPLSKTPAAALSAHLANELETKARIAGYQLYIEKPVKPEELVSRISVLAQSRGVH